MGKSRRRSRRWFRLGVLAGLVLVTASAIYIHASRAREDDALKEILIRAEEHVASDRFEEAVGIYDDLLLKEEDSGIRSLRENTLKMWKAHTDQESPQVVPEPSEGPLTEGEPLPVEEPQPGVVPLPAEGPGVEGDPVVNEGQPTVPKEKWTVVIDPGHQKAGNPALEPVGPGSTVMKKKVTSGTRGTTTGIYEYEYVLDVSLLVRDLLEEEGFHVIMTRTGHDVSLSNIDRAKIANDAKADLFLRVHANGSDNPGVQGISTYTPPRNSPFNSELAEKSDRVSLLLLEEIVKTTGAKDRGDHKNLSYTGINWSEVPVVILETGFMTNPEEDRLLNTEAYQMKLAEGILNALKRYFKA